MSQGEGKSKVFKGSFQEKHSHFERLFSKLFRLDVNLSIVQVSVIKLQTNIYDLQGSRNRKPDIVILAN